MKRLSVFLLCLTLLVALCSCSADSISKAVHVERPSAETLVKKIPKAFGEHFSETREKYRHDEVSGDGAHTPNIPD